MDVKSIKLIGTELKNYRKINSLTQQDIADLSGVSRKVVGELEQGKDTIQFNIVLKILSVTDLKLQIFGGES